MANEIVTLDLLYSCPYTLRFDGNNTSGLDHTSNAAAIQSALEANPSIGSGNVSVTGTFPNFTIEFVGALANTNVGAITVYGDLDKIVMQYDLSETVGTTVVDSSTEGADGTLSGDYTRGSGFVTFGGTDGEIQVPIDTWDYAGPQTLEFTINTTEAAFSIIFGTNYGSDSLYVSMGPSTAGRIAVYDGATWIEDPTTAVNDGNDYDVKIEIDPTSLRFYINSSLVHTATGWMPTAAGHAASWAAFNGVATAPYTLVGDLKGPLKLTARPRATITVTQEGSGGGTILPLIHHHRQMQGAI